MLETSARLLRVLSLLQSRPRWSGAQLSERLGVSTRTVRADIERLRALGYQIRSEPGTAGGYRLNSGEALPLLLDEDEAATVALSLRTAANGAVTDIEETALRALTKLLQIMPPRLRLRAKNLLAATSMPPIPMSGPTVNTAVLVELASAIQLRDRLRFEYTDSSGRSSRRTVEPEKLVHRWGRWYLIAFDLDRLDWRTFRADRLLPCLPSGPKFAQRTGGEQYLQRALAAGSWDYNVRIRVHSPASLVRERLPAETVVDADGDQHCHVELGANSATGIVVYLCQLDADFEIVKGADLAHQLQITAQRFNIAAGLTCWSSQTQ
ncbi:YafY family protein [Mycobacteroides abscessus]|nr:YafY family protein [Mycobacteroides abscessus]MDM1908542.1 YafY family protein [Mycobacteroides abscessus]MDM1913329.1 YafY family protein [Mycobacteroides abscessus]MDM1918545.1 YafY family protein [Mycobacteroides abscessus]